MLQYSFVAVSWKSELIMLRNRTLGSVLSGLIPAMLLLPPQRALNCRPAMSRLSHCCQVNL